MNKNYTLTLDKEFIQFCKLNNIIDIEKKAQEAFSRGFTIMKYGETPTSNKITEIIEIPKEIVKEVEVEKIVERIVEVPVEVIREVIKEVIVEKKGKTITKEIVKEVVNNDEINRLIKENEKLSFELNKITSSLDRLGKGRYIKKSDNSSLYDE